MHPRENAPGALEHAAGYLRRSMGATRRCRTSLPELRQKERRLLHEWWENERLIFRVDPTLTLERRSSHGEHTVGFDPASCRWWKITHPGTAGIGAEFDYEMLPPFRVTGIFARESLPSEYLDRMILHNREFQDNNRFEEYLNVENPSMVISQPDIKGSPATADQMARQMESLGYLSLGNLEVGRKNSISFYHADRRIALFDAHPGNFSHADGLTIPIDGILAEIPAEAEHEWLPRHVCR